MKKGTKMTKLIMSVAVSICVAVMMMGSAFAAEGGGVSGSTGASTHSSSNVSSTDPASGVYGSAVVDESLFQLQREVDDYMFVTHKEELAKQEFKITHTAPVNGAVEIGITPYEQGYADYLYNIFGNDKINVVMGEQAYILGAGPDTPVYNAVDPSVPANPTLGNDAVAEPNIYPADDKMEIAVVGQAPPAEGEMSITTVDQESSVGGDAAITSADTASAAEGAIAETVAVANPDSSTSIIIVSVLLALAVSAIVGIAYWARRSRMAKV